MRRSELRAPVSCLVTDRRRLAPGADYRIQVERLAAQASEAARAGVDLIQIRERDLEAAALCDLTRRMLDATAGSQTRVVVNDRVDVALAAGAAGVHLRADSIDHRRVRPLVPAVWILGRSVHRVEDLEDDAQDLDYVVFGTVFRSDSKPADDGIAGLAALTETVARATVPVLAIGGITKERLADVFRAGAAGIAAIGLFLPPDETDSRRLGPAQALGAIRQTFDTLRSLR
jgi:thiamine-phosphate diphosphorylase